MAPFFGKFADRLLASCFLGDPLGRLLTSYSLGSPTNLTTHMPRFLGIGLMLEVGGYLTDGFSLAL
jgi:hypothetical protein